MATIKKSKVDALYNHLNDGGAADPETLAELLEVDAEDTLTLEAYIRAVNKRKADEAPATTPEVTDVIFLNPDNTTERLEIVKAKGSKVFVQRAVKRDLVKLIVRGEEVTVDCEELRKLPADVVVHGFRVDKVLAAAELAR